MDALRSALQPITTNLPPPIKQLGITILGETCYASLIEQIDLENRECLKLAISKALGIGIIAASSVVKIPQIIKLLSSKSASGVSLLSTLLETTGYIISVAYNFRQGFPFSTFGETALIVVQNIVIAVLIMQFTGRGGAAAALVAGVATGGYALFQKGVVGEDAMKYLQASTIPLSLASKVPQIWTIHQQGGTGQLSAFAVFNFLMGSLARVYTTIQEVDDPLILYGFIGGAILNFVLAAQMVYYWNSPTTSSSSSRKRGKRGGGAKSKTATERASTPSTTTRRSLGSRQSSTMSNAGTPPKTRSKGVPDIDMDAAIASSGGEKPMTPTKGQTPKPRRKKKAAA